MLPEFRRINTGNIGNFASNQDGIAVNDLNVAPFDFKCLRISSMDRFAVPVQAQGKQNRDGNQGEMAGNAFHMGLDYLQRTARYDCTSLAKEHAIRTAKR